MSSLDFEGLERPLVGAEDGFWASRDESWEVKANEVEEEISLVLDVFALGMPYREALLVIAGTVSEDH